MNNHSYVFNIINFVSDNENKLEQKLTSQHKFKAYTKVGR